jgi:hypothetical protein
VKEIQAGYDEAGIAGFFNIYGREVDRPRGYVPGLFARIKLALKFILRAENWGGSE